MDKSDKVYVSGFGAAGTAHWSGKPGSRVTLCGRRSKGLIQDDALFTTCKRCAKLMATETEKAHAAAIVDDESRTIARAFSNTPSGVVLTWEEIAQAVKAREFANAAQELKAMDAASSAKLVELVSSPTAYPEAVALDTWLTEGMVLVGPATDSLYVFENWSPGGAVLRHVDTGALDIVAQANVIEWKYLPGVGSEEVLPAEVRLGDVVKFHTEGSYRKVRSIVRHGDTGLFSFSIEGSTIEFVRNVLEPVTRKELPTPRQ
jgi:hypothetical protein